MVGGWVDGWVDGWFFQDILPHRGPILQAGTCQDGTECGNIEHCSFANILFLEAQKDPSIKIVCYRGSHDSLFTFLGF